MTSSLLSRRFVAVAVLAVAALGAVSAAHAHSDVTWSIGINSPGAYVQPAPIYYPPPPPVYYQPRPVYVQPAPVYVPPRVVYTQPPVYGYYNDGPDWHRAQWERRHNWQRHHHGYRDWDRDDRDWDRNGR